MPGTLCQTLKAVSRESIGFTADINRNVFVGTFMIIIFVYYENFVCGIVLEIEVENRNIWCLMAHRSDVGQTSDSIF